MDLLLIGVDLGSYVTYGVKGVDSGDIAGALGSGVPRSETGDIAGEGSMAVPSSEPSSDLVSVNSSVNSGLSPGGKTPTPLSVASVSVASVSVV